jgi:hypothetical protein
MVIKRLHVSSDAQYCIFWLLLLGGIVQRVTCNCDHFLIFCAARLSYNHSRVIRQSSQLWLQQRHLVSTRREIGREMAAEFCLSVSLSHLKGSLTCPNSVRHVADGFTSLPKEVVLRIFITFKNPLLSTEFEPAKIRSNGTHDTRHTTKHIIYIGHNSSKFKCRVIKSQKNNHFSTTRISMFAVCNMFIDKLTLRSVTQHTFHLLWKWKVHHCVDNSQPPTPYHKPDGCKAYPPNLLKIHFNIILPPTPRSSEWSLSLYLPTRKKLINTL